MKKYFEYVTTVGYVLLVILPFVYGGWFLSGRYKNAKIECLKTHPGEETHYNVLSGCWYWSKRQQRMIKPDDYKERELIEAETKQIRSNALIQSFMEGTI